MLKLCILVLEHPGVLKNSDRVRETWQRAYGSENAHKVAVLEEGVKYTPIFISNNDAQFLETRKFQIEEIACLYRVLFHMIGDLGHATFSNIEQQFKPETPEKDTPDEPEQKTKNLKAMSYSSKRTADSLTQKLSELQKTAGVPINQLEKWLNLLKY